ncbi:hypothetical protein FOQG_19318 [Fusarium oxysporum f. sp. raphani 54005]|uniref:LisH domain-containing protein n=4 Tax=Fusarium oxysporum TaxID=5507 RepID=X0BBN1_FUSOX|nr:hypothetical protein FOQG_19318 [Fusarium oxysporum f. sp. raphani 54005]EXL65256.1 hypothetical protein FOPG_18510 [Fusarium oxysporum f. sp. conglutinans race 2 54008]KAG6980350.1 Transcriptional activator somA [Fusarium oxysporum f. sp. conglutinans]KAG7406792.1 Transcriptional activator somA [Fusarium oxysporum f. sp. raphani]KAI8401811.1 hypothetical protein FOFC_18680 [Fusarium oxysporum]
MANVNARTGNVHDASRHLQENCSKRTQLNTYIYEYFFHYGMLDCAQAILKVDSDVKVQWHGPRNPCDDEHCRLNNAFYNESVNIGFGFKRPEQRPIPSVLNLSPESCFLHEWFSLLWAMFNAQKNVHGRSEENQCAGLMQQQNRPRWNASRSRTQSSLLPPHDPARTTYNAFYNSGEMDVGNRNPRTSGAQACGRGNRALQEFQVQLTSMEQQNQDVLTARQGRSGLSRNDGVPGGRGGQGPLGPQLFQRSALQGARPEALPNTTNQMKLGTQQMNNTGMGGVSGNMAVVRMNGWTRASTSSHLCQQSNGQAMRQPAVAKEMQFQQQEETSSNGPVQWQNDPSENQIPQTAQREVEATLQEQSRRPSCKPGHANDSTKPISTIASPSQTIKAAPPTPQLGKAAREKRPVPKGTTPRKGTKKVKTEMVTWEIPKSNVSSGATPAARTTSNSVPQIGPVDIRQDTQNASLAQVVPTGQPVLPPPLTPASLVANAPVDLVQSVAFSLENPSMTDYASLPTFECDLHGFDLDSFLESSSKDLGVFHFNYFPSNMDAGDIGRD